MPASETDMRQIRFPGDAADQPGVAPAPKGKCGAGARSHARAVRVLIGARNERSISTGVASLSTGVASLQPNRRAPFVKRSWEVRGWLQGGLINIPSPP